MQFQENSTDIPKDYSTLGCSETNRVIHQNELKCLWGNCQEYHSDGVKLAAHVERDHIPLTSESGSWKCSWIKCLKKDHVFTSKYRLVRHLLTHTGEKPFICEFCPKKFARAANLRIHLRIHTGDKPYECKFPNCNKTFSNSSCRIKHHRTHQNVRYNCPTCEYFCHTAATLTSHHKKAHQTKLPQSSSKYLVKIETDTSDSGFSSSGNESSPNRSMKSTQSAQVTTEVTPDIFKNIPFHRDATPVSMIQPTLQWQPSLLYNGMTQQYPTTTFSIPLYNPAYNPYFVNYSQNCYYY